LAQSTAAIVGLMGGFLAQQLLAQRRDVAERRSAVREEALALLDELFAARTRIAGVVKSLRSYLELVQDGKDVAGRPDTFAVLAPPDQNVTAAEGLGSAVTIPADFEALLTNGLEVGGELYDSLPSDFMQLSEALRLRGDLPQPNAAWLERTPWSEHSKPTSVSHPIQWLAFQRDVAQEQWIALSNSARRVGLKLTSLQAILVPSSLYWVLGILGALLAVGVIAPMFLLTARNDATKLGLMAAFIPLATALIVYFGYELRRLRRADRLHADTF
jgi:hypothetical protein